MRGRTVALAASILCASASAEDATAMQSRDGFFVAAAAVPSSGTVRVAAAGAAANASADGEDSAGAAVSAWVLWSVGARVAISARLAFENGRADPAVSLRYQLLSQASHGLNVSASTSLRAVGFESAGPEIAARVSLGRSLGLVDVTANASLGHGLGARRDVDYEGAAKAGVPVTSWLTAALEGRAHGELVETYVTAEDVGRPVGLLFGPSVSIVYEGLQVQGLIGWPAPRGSVPPGATGVVTGSFDF